MIYFQDEYLDELDARITKRLSEMIQFCEPMSVEHLLVARIHTIVQNELHILDAKIYQDKHQDEMTEIPTEDIPELHESKWGRSSTETKTDPGELSKNH